MAMEVVCGNCHGRLMVEQTGVVVACPHCAAHLQIGDPAPPPAPAPASVPPPPVVTPPWSQQAAPPAPTFAPPQPAPPQPAPPPPVMPSPAFVPPPISFEPAVTRQSSASPEPLFPEINLNPQPTAPVPPAALPPAPLPPVSVPPPAPTQAAPAPEVTISLPPPVTSTASDSWMPKIDLTMPPPTTEAPPTPPAAPAAGTYVDSPTIAMMPNGTSPFGFTEPVEPQKAGPAEQTDIWKPAAPDAAPAPAFPAPSSGSSSLPSFGDFGQLAATSFGNPTLADKESSKPVTQTAHEKSPIATEQGDRPHVSSVPMYLFIMVASYASAITIGFIYLWINGATSTLDLPDLVPKIDQKSGQVGLMLAPETPLPLAYRLKLGESKRYGNVMVTPIKVTKGPLEFTHFLGTGQTKPPTQSPVLKLWVKFENVSSDQTFPALDEQLMFRRATDKENITQDKSNNYVCQQSERKRIGKRVGVYTLPLNGEWLLKDQQLNTWLKPKDEWQTYIPSNDEDLSSLTGPLTWRMQFRKGYHPRTHHGVTTLVEVEFDSQDIQADS